MMMTRVFCQMGLLGLTTLLAISLAHAHGENKPGPHGGWIRMPGAFHTEVVPVKEGFKVYLLDIQFQNPIVTHSSVTASIQSNNQTISLACKSRSDYFYCTTNKKFLTQAASLELSVIRDQDKGVTMRYTLL